MAFLPDTLVKSLTEFRGPKSAPDAYLVRPPYARAAQNVSYFAGSVGTRYGHSEVFNPNEAVSALFNWLYNYAAAPRNTLLRYVSATGVRFIDLANIGGGSSTIIAQTGAYGAKLAPAGSRIYAAFFNSAGVGMAPGQVYSFAVGADALFAPPITTSPTFSEPVAGLVTAGSHRVGYLIQTRNGFTTKPSPASVSASFTPVTTVASGAKTLRVTINPASWPTYAAQIQIVMTTVANPNRYYLVPGATITVPGGSPFSATIDVSISDDDLAATGTDASAFLNLLTQDTLGDAPFNPSFILMSNNRAWYVTRDAAGIPVVYASDQDAYQQVNAAFSGIYLPGQLEIKTAFSIRNATYIVGPHWTYSVTDQGGYPTSWQRPLLVDGRIGSLCPHGVDVNAAQGYAWVVDEGGLYLFQGGNYAPLPVSYYDANWKRINWAAAASVQVWDDKNKKCVHVLVPLDTAVTPTHELIYDYTNGVDCETIMPSLKVQAHFAPGAGCVVQNDTSKHTETWLAPAAAGRVIRENDGTETNPYRDVKNSDGTADAIDCPYETALLPGPGTNDGSQIHMGHAVGLRVRGNDGGDLMVTVYTLDHGRACPVNNGNSLKLSSAPARELMGRFSAVSEQASVQLETNAVDSWWLLAGLQYYYTRGPMQR